MKVIFCLWIYGNKYIVYCFVKLKLYILMYSNKLFAKQCFIDEHCITDPFNAYLNIKV